MDEQDVHEWGGFDLERLIQFRYENVWNNAYGDCATKDQQQQGVHTSTFAECMSISQLSSPEEASEKYQEQQSNKQNEAILLLGCGTSKMGEQILMNSFVGPVLQIDISSKLIKLMSERYQKYLTEASEKRMELIVDDAKGLTSLSPESVGGGVLDKGLIDVLHMSSGAIDDNGNNSLLVRGGDGVEDSIREIVDSIHRVLQPSRPFVFFSRSGPEYILRRTFGSMNWDKERRRNWKEADVMKLDDLGVYLYRFVKADAQRPVTIKPKKKRRKQ